jgi:hypothetical protein
VQRLLPRLLPLDPRVCMMAPKRPSDDNFSQQQTKAPKIEPGNHAASPMLAQLGQPGSPSQSDFSGSVKKKLASSSRTGQACDRCKVSQVIHSTYLLPNALLR